MTGTRIVAVRQALITGVDALPAFDGVECSLGWKSDSEAAERLYTRRPIFNQEPASLRRDRTFRDERGTFEVIIRVEGIDDTQETTSTRAVALGTALEEWVADNRSPAGVMWLAAKGRGELAELFNDLGTLALLSYTFAYQARLT